MFTTHELSVADTCPAGKFLPLVVLPGIQRKSFHPLTERKILAHTDHVERSLPAEIDYQLRGFYVIVARPVRVASAVNHVSWREPSIAISAARVACSDA